MLLYAIGMLLYGYILNSRGASLIAKANNQANELDSDEVEAMIQTGKKRQKNGVIFMWCGGIVGTIAGIFMIYVASM